MNQTAPAAEAVEQPWYRPAGDEVEVFLAAWQARLPVLLKGPTGCGKTRFIEHMAWRINQGRGALAQAEPLVTVACNEDLTASDLVGRYLLRGAETVWVDGPLTRAVRAGSICYLDEVVEARKDTLVLIHSLTDHRRILPVDKRSETLGAHPDFQLVISYNPGYQSVLKDLKTSTRQRFVAMEFGYPEEAVEAEIIAHESGVDATTAGRLASVGARVRNLAEHGLQDGVSTRLLIYAGQLMHAGIATRRACDAALIRAAADDPSVQQVIGDVVDLVFPSN